MGDLPGANIVAFPLADSLRPDQVVGELGKPDWESLIGIGITSDGDFHVLASDMTAERALWIVEWARQWALGLDDLWEDEDGGTIDDA